MESNIYIVSPGNYYSFQRKHAYLEFRKGFSYQFDLQNRIGNILTSQQSSCSAEMNWKVDNCKLSFINNKIMNSLNCTAPWLLQHARYSNKIVFIFTKLFRLTKPRANICTSNSSAAANKMFIDIRYPPYDTCERPCTNVQTAITIQSSVENGENEIGLFFIQILK